MYLGPGADDCNEDLGEGDEVFTESGDEAPSVDDDEISRQLTPATPEPVRSRGGGPGGGAGVVSAPATNGTQRHQQRRVKEKSKVFIFKSTAFGWKFSFSKQLISKFRYIILFLFADGKQK